MRIRRKTIAGRIGPNGEIQASWNMLQDFCNGHKGKAVIVRVDIQPVEPTERTKNYFFGYVLPELQNALMSEYGEHLSKEQVYNQIRQLCPLFREQERVGTEWKTRVREFEELDQAEAGDAIDWIVQFAAENLNWIIEVPC